MEIHQGLTPASVYSLITAPRSYCIRVQEARQPLQQHYANGTLSVLQAHRICKFMVVAGAA